MIENNMCLLPPRQRGFQVELGEEILSVQRELE